MKPWIATAACLLINLVSLGHALAEQRPPHGYLGVGMANITEERVKELKLKDARGVLVTNVGADTPAAKAGLKESDVIVEFNGQAVDSAQQFQRVVGETAPGRKVAIRIVREGASQTLTATLTARPAAPLNMEFNFSMPPMPPMPPMPDGPWTDATPPSPPVYLPAMPHAVLSWRQTAIGIEAESIAGQLADYFGVKEGVLVRAVSHGSPAEKAGMRAGDVVVRVAADPVRTVQDLTRGVRSQGRGPVTLAVVRNHKEMNLALKATEGNEN